MSKGLLAHERPTEGNAHPSDALMKVPSFGPLESAPCNLCGSPDSALLTVQHWFGEDFRIVRCTGCSLIRTNPRPTAAWKSSFYDPRCNGLAATVGRDFIYAPDADRLPSYARLLRYILAFARPGQRLIDVGAASGAFAAMARDAGLDAVACDFSADALAYGAARYGIQTLQSPAEAIAAPDASFDVVTILHTIEHVPDPLRVLRELYRILKPGGMLFLETPNYQLHALIETRLRFLQPLYRLLTKKPAGLPWVPFDHYYHWTPPHLCEALRRAGFSEARARHIFGYRSNTKPNLMFWCAYMIYDCLAQMIYLGSFGRYDLRLVLLATATK